MKKLIVLILIVLAGGYLVLRNDSTSEIREEDVKDNQEVVKEEEVKDEEEEQEDSEDGEVSGDTEADTNESASEENSSEVEAGSETEGDVEASSSDYNDGTYTSDVTYALPNGGSHDMSVQITVENDVVTNVELSFDGENGSASNQTQVRFAGAINPFVLTKDLDEITPLSRIGGASLTTDAFNEAVAEIKTNAS